MLIKPSPYFLLFFAQYPWYNYWDFADKKDNSRIKHHCTKIRRYSNYNLSF